MSDAENPYRSPETAATSEKRLIAQGALTETMLIYLKGASPWLRFIGILGFISAGMTALWGLSAFAFVPLMGQVWDEIGQEIEGFEAFSGVFTSVFGGTMAVFCIGGAVIIFFPSLFVYRFGEKIRSYLRTGMEQDLEQAFKNNKSLWKFYGIICIISLATFPLMIIGTVIAAVAVAIGR